MNVVKIVCALIVTVGSTASGLSQDTTNSYTLNYEGLGIGDGVAIPNPYPGITDAAVTNAGFDNQPVSFEAVTFWGGVSPGNGYGDLTNVAVGPQGTPSLAPAWGTITIAPTNANSFIRLISFDIASKDDDDVDEANVEFYVTDLIVGGALYWFSTGNTIAGDLVNTSHTQITFGGAPITIAPGQSVKLWWQARNGRLAVDNIKFEVITPEVITPGGVQNDFYTVRQGGTLSVTSPGVLANDEAVGAVTVALGTAQGDLYMTNDGGFAYVSTNAAGMDGFIYQVDEAGDIQSAAALISVLPPGALFYDDFARPAGLDVLTPWQVEQEVWSVSNGVMEATTEIPASHAYAFIAQNWTNYSVEAQARYTLPSSSFDPNEHRTWNVSGRFDPATGARYELNVLYEGPVNDYTWIITLAKFFPSGSTYRMVTYEVPDPGTNTHTLKLTFEGNRILAYYDDMVSETTDIDSPLESGGIRLGMYRENNPLAVEFDNVLVRTLDPTASDLVVVTSENIATNLVLEGSVETGTKTFGLPIGGGPAHGALSGFNANSGAVTYTPDPGYFGPDAFNFTVSDGTLYATGLVAITVTAGVSKETPIVQTSPVASAITYGQTLAASTVTGGVFTNLAGVIVDMASTNFVSPTIVPNAGATNVLVYFVPVDTVNYNNVTNTVMVSVNKGTPIVQTSPVASAITYGQTLARSTVTGGVFTNLAGVTVAMASTNFVNPTIAPNAGTTNVLVYYVPVSTANYNNVTNTVTVSVNKGTPIVQASPVASAITYGQTLARSTVTGGVFTNLAGVTVAMASTNFVNPTIAPNVGTTNVLVYYVPVSTANYNNVTNTVTVSVNKGTPIVQTAPVASAITYGQTLSASTLSGAYTNLAGTLIPGTLAFTNSAILPKAGSTNVFVKFTPTDTVNYNSVTNSTPVNVTVNALPVQLSGTRVYNGTAVISATSLSVVNNLDGVNLTLTGTGELSSKDVGSRTISAQKTLVRVNSAKASKMASVTNLSVTVSAPVNGNTLVAVISTTGTSSNRVSSITQTGATWSRAAQSANASGTTTEIWYAPNVTGAGTNVTVAAPGSKAAAVVMEYSGILIAGALDQTAGNTGTGTNATTGTTPPTVQSNELWIGGIGLADDNRTLSPILNSFTLVDSQTVAGSGADMEVHALERIVTTNGPASSGGTVNTSVAWSGAIATFKATGSHFILSGSAAVNYTLNGLSGSVDITKANLTPSIVANNKVYDGSTQASLSAVSVATIIGSENVSLTITSTNFASAAVGTGKTVTASGLGLTGADSANYQLTATEATTTANITQRGLTVTATGVNKVYDATANATVDLSDNRIVGDVFITSYTASFLNSNAGNGKVVNVSSIAITGLDAPNYNLLNTTTNTTANITKRDLSVTADDKSKVFGDVNPPLTGSLVGVQGTDNITATYTTTAETDSQVGEYVIEPVLQDPGSSLVNYNVTTNNGTLTIVVLAPSLVSISESPEVSGEFTVTWQVVVGRSYRFEWKADLLDTEWTDLFEGQPDYTAISSSAAIIHDAGEDTHGFYRVLDVTPAAP